MVPVLFVAAIALIALTSWGPEVNPAFTTTATIAVAVLFAVYHGLTARRLRSDAETDPLTECFNRRAGIKKLKAEVARSLRYGRPLSLISLDVDKFKNINDTFGHPAGDEVLKTVAKTLLASCRNTDAVIRAGGEEFWVLLPETPIARGGSYAERLRQKLEQNVVVDGRPIKVTASLGVTGLAHKDSLEQMIKRADQALYAAKAGGRNLVRVA